MRHFDMVMAVAVATIACATPHPISSSAMTAESIQVFRLDNDGLMGCREIGLLAETDGAIALSEKCSCERPELATGTEAGVMSRLRLSAAELGANAVWLLKVHQRDALVTHSECCSVSGYRAYGVAFKCDDSQLEWHKKHEALATQ